MSTPSTDYERVRRALQRLVELNDLRHSMNERLMAWDEARAALAETPVQIGSEER